MTDETELNNMYILYAMRYNHMVGCDGNYVYDITP
jgi:hypothetical protein